MHHQWIAETTKDASGCYNAKAWGTPMSKRTLHYSVVQFRVNPADEACGVEHLGFILGLTTDRYRAVSLAFRTALNPELMKRLDPLSREILEHRVDILKAEIEHVFSSEASLQDVLRAVSEANQWSLYVSQPHVTELAGEAVASSARLAEDYRLEFFNERQWLPVTPLHQVSRIHSFDFGNVVSYQPDRDDGRSSVHEMVPPPWMLDPKAWPLLVN
jgi:hypothetical protein